MKRRNAPAVSAGPEPIDTPWPYTPVERCQVPGGPYDGHGLYNRHGCYQGWRPGWRVSLTLTQGDR